MELEPRETDSSSPEKAFLFDTGETREDWKTGSISAYGADRKWPGGWFSVG